MRFERHYANPELNLWTRIVLYAVDHDGEPLERGQLHQAMDPHRLIRSAEISRAIRDAVRKGMLQPGSSSSLLLFTAPEDEAA